MTARTLLLVVLHVCVSINATIDHRKAQLDWIVAKGGFVSSKLEIRRSDPSDSKSPFGVFATADIAKNESLMRIPQACLITSGGSLDICDTTRNLIKQHALGEESTFAPYVRHVFDPEFQGSLPASWSEEGQELLTTIIGNEMGPYDVTDTSFEDHCGGSGDPLEEEAYLTVTRRSWDDIMVPGFDMVNHRNGKWKNVDSNSAHDGKDITVHALRDISNGEQLYLSYNECADCDFALTYVLQDILKDYGFVEQYPRRWRFVIEKDEALVFEIDEVAGNELELTWLSSPPSEYEVKFLRGHLVRLRHLEDYVMTQADKVVSSHERVTSLEFYHALMTALDFAVWSGEEHDEEEDCEVSTGGDPGACEQVYDQLDEASEMVDFNFDICDFGYADLFTTYQRFDNSKSHYSRFSFEHSKELKDTCLYLNEHLQACASFRPHYHEVFVHYPARFVDEVKRIAFIGGGDNMILHEILKYPSLELVVGMELDQMVVRNSFKNFGTQPHWDNDKVQWWYGDGSKSILMLPKEYFGTFDLVLLDLETDVVEMLRVAKDRDIMDAAFLLLKPDGVMARNEDWEFATNKPFTDYAIDLFYVDVPVLCHQGITIGSNTVNFLTQAPKDHGIETVFLKQIGESETPYDLWYNFRKSDTHTTRLCRPWPEEKTSNPGVVMILEAEDVTVPLNSSAPLHAAARQALGNAGLTLVSTKTLYEGDGRTEGYEIVFILREGYAIARSWIDQKYCAFDVLLWSDFEKQTGAKEGLAKAVGSSSTSSFRIVTGGMFGSDKGDSSKAGPRVNGICKPPTESFSHTPVQQGTINAILSEGTSLIQGAEIAVAVLCGEQTDTCDGLTFLAEQKTGMKVVPVWTCLNADRDMFDCESQTLRSLEELYEANGTIDVLVIDPKAPRTMGQILHKLLKNTHTRRGLLPTDFLVLAITLDSSETWRRALVDRFRTDFITFDPAYRASVFFNSTSSSIELSVFSSGDSSFFKHFADAIARIENTTGFLADVRSIRNGINNYVADFQPSLTCSHDTYDSTAPLKQWSSQKPLAEQTIFQFTHDDESEEALTASEIHDAFKTAIAVMYEYEQHATVHVYDDVGDGTVATAVWSIGSAVLSWDGRSHITVNFFAYVTASPVDFFSQVYLQKIPSLSLSARDNMPRGIGRVVNFPSQLGEQRPHWATVVTDS